MWLVPLHIYCFIEFPYVHYLVWSPLSKLGRRGGGLGTHFQEKQPQVLDFRHTTPLLFAVLLVDVYSTLCIYILQCLKLIIKVHQWKRCVRRPDKMATSTTTPKGKYTESLTFSIQNCIYANYGKLGLTRWRTLVCLEYCRIQIKLTPLHDCDMPDEIFFSSLHFGSHDMAKISSVIAIELYILVMFGVKFIAVVHC